MPISPEIECDIVHITSKTSDAKGEIIPSKTSHNQILPNFDVF